MSELNVSPVLPRLHCEVLVIGAGPAGIAAALTAVEAGKNVLLIDQQHEPGGQIWRGQWRQLQQQGRSAERLALRWLSALSMALAAHAADTANATDITDTALTAGLRFRGDCRAVACEHTTVIADGEQAAVIQFKQVILCAGAREIFLPFPGWTLPGVTGVGGLQVMVKDGVSVRDQRVVVAGTGPLLLAVAESLQRAGAHVVCMLEQAPRRALLTFATQLWRYPVLLWQALQLRWRTRRIPLHCASWVTQAEGAERLSHVHWRHGDGQQNRVACAWLACGFALTENEELLALFGAKRHSTTAHGFAVETDHPSIFIAGELLGVGGARRALISGQFAAAKAVADTRRSAALELQLHRWQPYLKALQTGFSLRRDLLKLADEQTLLCRCECVSVGAVRQHGDFRSAKLATRLGMGVCQGRICGAACHELFGWRVAHTRAPLLPTPIRSLLVQLECNDTPEQRHAQLPAPSEQAGSAAVSHRASPISFVSSTI
jgi:D-hydroxyproline dehydrogenase subunit alpha